MNGMDGWKTWIMGMFAMVLTFVGCLMDLFSPDVFYNVMYAVMGSYGLKSAVGKIAASRINNK